MKRVLLTVIVSGGLWGLLGACSGEDHTHHAPGDSCRGLVSGTGTTAHACTTEEDYILECAADETFRYKTLCSPALCAIVHTTLPGPSGEAVPATVTACDDGKGTPVAEEGQICDSSTSSRRCSLTLDRVLACTGGKFVTEEECGEGKCLVEWSGRVREAGYARYAYYAIACSGESNTDTPPGRLTDLDALAQD